MVLPEIGMGTISKSTCNSAVSSMSVPYKYVVMQHKETKMELGKLHEIYTLQTDRELRKVRVAMKNYPERIAELRDRHDRIKKMVEDLEDYRKFISNQ